MTDVRILLDRARRVRVLARHCPSAPVAAVLAELAEDCEDEAARLLSRGDRSALH